MQTSYIYSVSRVNTLTQFLLNKTDIERLLVADPGEDLQSALKETYLAPFVVRVPDESVPLAVEQTLIDAKRMIHKIAPNGDMLRVLWLQYDVHNLRVFAKATAKDMSLEECQPYLSLRGIHQPEYLHAQSEAKQLSMLHPNWQEAYDQAVEQVTAGRLDLVDGIFDDLYFTTSRHIVETLGDTFMERYFATLVDLFNLKSRLRHLKNADVELEPAFVCGGTLSANHIETQEDVFAMFARHGGAAYWQEALESFVETGNFTQIDARAAERLMVVAKEGSSDMFSSASLVLYYLKCRQAAANIRTIVVGKNNGLPLEDIRANLRMAYVND